jgi:hypothetical protein
VENSSLHDDNNEDQDVVEIRQTHLQVQAVLGIRHFSRTGEVEEDNERANHIRSSISESTGEDIDRELKDDDEHVVEQKNIPPSKDIFQRFHEELSSTREENEDDGDVSE